MGLGFREGRLRERRKRRLKTLKWLVVLGIYVGLGVFAYNGGSRLAARKVVRLEDQVAGLKRTVAGLTKELAVTRKDRAKAKIREQGWRARYTKDVPVGNRKDLLTLVDKRLADGVRPDRLSFVIGGVRNRPDCDGTPLTRRFLVQTPISIGPISAVGFHENLITVTAVGESAVDPNGKPVAWFDPAKPITARFTRIGGKGVKASGKLPLHHAMAIGDSEHRFSISEGERRGFANITWMRCAFP